MHIAVLRPQVQICDDGMGIQILLPRYYKWSDIRNRANTDFRPLKAAMGAMCRIGRLQVKKDSKRELAERHMEELLKADDDKRTAWEATRLFMGWEKRYMEDLFGRCPKRSE